jgi:fructose-specific phosphotransferase system IIC component
MALRHALPFFVGMTVGIYSFQVGAGPFGAIVVGFVAGSTTLVAGQFAFSVARSPIVRLVVGLLFAPISVFPLNGGARRLPSSVPSPSVVPPGRACR